jgi:hypothetical protein
MFVILINWFVKGAAISFAAIGDANSDQAPLQVGQFEADNRLDEVLSKFWIEEGGGGTGQESYELAAYYYAKHSILDCNRKGKKGFFFFVGDEGFYPSVSPDHVEKILGRSISGPVPSLQAFQALQEKYHVFFVQPEKTWEERKADQVLQAPPTEQEGPTPAETRYSAISSTQAQLLREINAKYRLLHPGKR